MTASRFRSMPYVGLLLSSIFFVGCAGSMKNATRRPSTTSKGRLSEARAAADFHRRTSPPQEQQSPREIHSIGAGTPGKARAPKASQAQKLARAVRRAPAANAPGQSWFLPPPPSWFVPPPKAYTPPPYPTIPLPKHRSFRWIVRRFRTAKWGFTATILKRRGLYRDIVLRELKRMHLPLGLIVLAGIESNYTPRLISPTGAMGMWQFIDRTGKEVGLKRTPWIDERRNIIKSTRAALRYVHSLYRQFDGDWGLAIAAYNCGPGCIRAAMKRCKGKSIWWMRLRGCGISREARAYVARFFALLYFLKHPPNGWKTFPTVEPVARVTVKTPGPVSLLSLSKATGVSLRTLYELNPELSSWMTPPHTRYPLQVPPKFAAKARRFMRRPHKQFRWRPVTIQEGMSLTKICRKYRVPRRVLRYTNRTWGLWSMKNRKHLILPLPLKAKRWPRRLKRKHRKKLYALLKSSRRHGWRFPAYFRYHSRHRYISHKKKLPCYVARKGDTFRRIARRFKVSVGRLRRRNHHLTSIRKGCKVRVFAASQCYIAPPQRPFRPPLAD